MVNTLDMQDLRQLNLFQKVTGIRTRYCFPYNNMILYCVPKSLISKAVGKEASNLSINIEVFDDCTTGGWSNGACCVDPPFQIYSGNVLPNLISTSLIYHY